jgi:hypothetical protein
MLTPSSWQTSRSFQTPEPAEALSAGAELRYHCRSSVQVNSLSQRRYHPNVGLLLCIAWCAGVWFTAFHFIGLV